MISVKDKNKFIQLCLGNYPENGKDNFIFIQIDDEEEEQEPVSFVMPIALEYFLNEYPEIRSLGEKERWKFFEYLYGDYDLETRKLNDLVLIFKNGIKKKIY